MLRRCFALPVLFAVGFGPAQTDARADGLTIADMELAHGVIGPTREGDDFYPADDLIFRFRATGVSLDDGGQCRCRVGCELLNAKGESLQDLEGPIRSILALGGGEFPAHFRFRTPGDMAAGKYTFVITITDEVAGTSATAERTLNCRPTAYRILTPRLSHDPEAKIPGGTYWTLGERLFFRLMVVGSDRSGDKLHVVMRVQILDERGKPTLAEPLRFELKEDDPAKVKDALSATLSGSVGLNRAGKYTLRIGVEDPIGEQKAAVELPITVYPL